MRRNLLRMAATALTVAGLTTSVSAGDWPWSRNKAVSDHQSAGDRLNNAYDPCWPQRYNAVARQEVLAPFAQQALNGHVINQTVWNYHFEPGSDRITAAGVEKLDSLVRIRPSPDTKIYIQTARDLSPSPDTVDRLHADRMALDIKRANMVAKFLAAEPQRFAWEIYVHDPADPSINSTAASNAFRAQLQGYLGGIQGGGGVGAQGAGGGAAPAAPSSGATPPR